MKKIIFFDLDNTIFSTKHQKFLPNTLKMLDELSKKDNISLGIATGRAPHRMPMLKDVKHYFKYFVYVNGGLAYDEQNLIVKEILNKNLIKEVIKELSKLNIPIGLVGLKNEYITVYDERVISGLKGFNDEKPVKYNENIFDDEVFQIWIFTEDKNILNKIKLKYPNLSLYPWHKGGADLTSPKTNKAIAIKKIVENKKNHQLICIGDGFNDVNMIKIADIGIAMENSGFDLLKESADLIAPHIDNDLLYFFLKENNII